MRFSGYKVWLSFIGLSALLALGAFHPCQASSSPHLNIVSHFKTRSKPFSLNTKIFLVAGSSQTANFTQEILDQRRLWQSIGFREDEISCYYVIPTLREYRHDHDQYLELAMWLPDCYPASAKVIREHLLAVAKQDPPFLYFYMTSHGKKPISVELREAEALGRKTEALIEHSQYPVLDQFRLMIEALPDGPATESQILEAYKKGKNPRDLYFTPAYLREVLLEFKPHIPKILVLQGCYSGGFIQDTQTNFKEKRLTSVPQITILTAASNNRPSFGCSAGPLTTYYGGVFNQVLSTYLGDPRKMKWENLYEDVIDKVIQLEREMTGYESSQPTFYSNF